MRLPLRLRLYRWLHPVPAGPPMDWLAPRPAGPLIWLHAASAAAAGGFTALLAELRQQRPAPAVVISCPEPLPDLPAVVVAPPPDHPAAVATFLDHWRPDLGIWAGGELAPVLLHALRQRAVPLVLVDTLRPDVAGSRWWPGLRARALAAFHQVMVVDDAAARRFRSAGVVADRIIVAGRLDRPVPALPVNEVEREALARALGTRPRWLAVAVPAGELDAVAQAQLAALRMAHRLLLILVPADIAAAPELAARLTGDHGLKVALRSCDEEPEDDVQVYLADTEGELGLWYRLAPLTWCGGTLTGSAAIRHPFEAVAAGSALIHGPQVGAMGGFADLLAAEGSRQVTDAAALGEAIGDLLAPDLCARQAAAAWEVALGENGATARVLDFVAAQLART